MTERTTPNTLAEMLQSCINQHEHMDAAFWGYGSDWTSDCQAFVHCMWGLRSGGFGSAYAQWLGLDAEDRLTMTELKGSLDNAPLGSSLFTKGSSPYGHTYPAARAFDNGTSGAWSTDLWRTGLVGKVARNAPMTKWGHHALGAGLSVNGYALDLTGKQPPKPKQNKRYQRIERAHHNLGLGIDDIINSRNNLRRALDTAEAHHDLNDATRIKRHLRVINEDIADLHKELKRLEGLYEKARHA